ncbi:MAG: class I SAM-dependent RNA methyltransferase [Tissierellia bacterium]|nr:class I SAM-dependent RNA methyltransferase [Tissierellia bacterium]
MNQNIKIRDLSHAGEGVGLINEKVCFVPGLLPGEEAFVEVIENKKNFQRGRVLELLQPSEHRVSSPCPYQGECGGCPLMPLEYNEQFLWKKNFSERTMKKMAGLDLIYGDLIPADKTLFYRNKLTLFIENGKVGFKEQRSSQVVPIENCMVADESFAPFFSILEGREDLFSAVLRKADEGVMVILQGERLKKDYKFYRELAEAGAKSIYFSEQKKGDPSLSGRLSHLRGEKTLSYHVMGREFSLTPRSFFQIHKEQARKLYELVRDFADLQKDQSVLDLYCGQGTLGAYLASYARNVIGVEVVQEAVNQAEQSIPSNMELLQGRVEHMDLPKVDVVILDPPRAGVEDQVIQKLLDMGPDKILYVSCNPVTQARDIKKLLTSYSVEKAGLVDLFPNTAHIESVMLLTRNLS